MFFRTFKATPECLKTDLKTPECVETDLKPLKCVKTGLKTMSISIYIALRSNFIS